MQDENKLPNSLTLAAEVLPPGEEQNLGTIDVMTLVGRLNRANRRLQGVIQESGNGRRFRETRDRLYQGLAAGKDIAD